MSLYDRFGEGLNITAMELFYLAGHAIDLRPQFANHTPEEFVYFDNKTDVVLSSAQRSLFRLFNNISFLFSCNNCSFYSINLLTSIDERSQIAHKIHTMLHPIMGTHGTVCLFQCDDKIMLSFVGFGMNCVLSDWFSEDDFASLQERLDISNMSIEQESEYFYDFVFALARRYYIYPPNELTLFQVIPTNYLSGFGDVDREELNEIVDYEISAARREYGFDYVDYDETSSYRSVDVGEDLDLMILELDITPDNPFGDESFFDEDDAETDEEQDDQKDEYEYEDIDPKILQNPELLVKWLRKNPQ